MATLIQSKQIQGIVTASVVEGDFAISGSLNVSGSGIFTNDITASGVISASQILGVKYEDIEGTPNFIAGTGILITEVGDTITITNTGGGGGVSGSAELISSVAQLNAYTASTDIRLDGLSSQTGSYLTSLPSGLVSGSDQLTSSYDQRYALSGSIGGGSTDISSLNDYTSSTDSRLTNIESFSSSIESRVTTLENQTDNTGSDAQTLSIVGDQLSISDGNTVTIPTGSGGGTSDFTELTNVPSGLVSSSEQVLGGTGILSGSHTDISSLNNFTSSIQSQVDGLSQQTSSYLTELPSGVISGSSQITELGFTSESTDISSLNDFTQSYFTDSASFDTRIDNLVSSTVPQGTISGSDQLTGSYDLRYLLSGSDLSVSFNGDREVTNQDLGVSGDNFGTTGSLKDFIEAVFFPNTLPTITYSERDVDVSGSVSGSVAIDVTLTDTENNGPFSFSISGGDSNKFDVVPQNADSSSWDIVIATSSLQVGTYEITGSASDNTNEATVLSTTFTVSPINDFGKVYIYTSTRVGAGSLSPATYLSIMGGSGVNGEAPPQVTSFTADAGSPFIKLVSGSLGDSTISVTGGTMTLRATVSGSDLTDIITGSFSGDGVVQEMFFIAFPSGSDMVGTPTSMTDSLGGSTSGEYVLYSQAAGESGYTVKETTIHTIEFNSETDGFSKWNIIGRTTPSTAASYELRIVPSSGSAPS